MNIVFLSNCDPEFLPIIHEVENRIGLSWLIRLCSPPSTVEQVSSAESLWSPQYHLENVWNRFNVWRKRKAIQHFDEQFPEPLQPPLPKKTVELLHSEINEPKGIALLRDLNPDLLLVVGAPLLKSQVFTIPRYGALNLHFGCAPDYRGLDTIFWALYHRDFRRIGITIHYMDAKLDHGRILARGFPIMDPDDNETTLFIKCVKLLVEMLPQVLLRFGENPPRPAEGTRASEGRLFLARERRFRHNLYYAFRRKLMRERLPKLPERREFLF